MTTVCGHSIGAVCWRCSDEDPRWREWRKGAGLPADPPDLRVIGHCRACGFVMEGGDGLCDDCDKHVRGVKGWEKRRLTAQLVGGRGHRKTLPYRTLAEAERVRELVTA